MKLKLIQKFSLVLILLPFLLISTPVVSDIVTRNNFVILIDDSHNQFINSSLLTGAINDLEKIGFSVVSTSDGFSNSTLTGVDLVIIPNPGDSTYTPEERASMDQWLLQGKKGLILLANPLFPDNNSLNGNIKTLNSIISEPSIGLNSDTFISSESSSKDPVKVQTLESLGTDSLTIYNVNSSILQKNNSSNLAITTSSTSLKLFPSEVILSAGYSSFVIGKNDLYSGFEGDNFLFGAIEKDNNRFILGGSTIMFSDLPNEENNLNTWYETANNSIFWQGIINWAVFYEENTSINQQNGENVFFLVFLSVLTGTAFLITGFFMFVTGKEIKLFDSSLVSST
ncbi:MAG: hypothetical protein ACC656_13825, partial [Candidatus Heimdallarchaeota archaeon]